MKTGHTLITGIGRRAGFHLARSFLERGMPVIGTYRTEYTRLHKLEALGAELYQCDFHKREDVEHLIAAVKERHKDLRGIVHNASQWISEAGEEPDNAVIDKMMRVHATIPYELNQALGPLLMAHDGPHADIIHVGDYVSGRGSKKHIAYAASKAAQDNLTLSFAQKLAPKVKVNSVAPALLAFNDHDEDDYKSKALGKSLMHREGGFDELQRAVDYLFDSHYVTGRILPLDGGRHLK